MPLTSNDMIYRRLSHCSTVSGLRGTKASHNGLIRATTQAIEDIYPEWRHVCPAFSTHKVCPVMSTKSTRTQTPHWLGRTDSVECCCDKLWRTSRMINRVIQDGPVIYICLFAGSSANPLIYPKISDPTMMSSLARRFVEGQDPPPISHALSIVTREQPLRLLLRLASELSQRVSQKWMPVRGEGLPKI